MKDIRTKLALVTGGAMGMGKLWCRHLAADGARLAIWDVNAQALEATAKELTAGGAEVHTAVVDVRKRQAVYDEAAKLAAEAGPVEILINNAGIVSAAPLLEHDDDKLQATIDINLTALLWTIKAVLPHMLAQDRGHIVNVSSASGFLGVPFMPAYTASKWGVIGLTESLRLELKQLGKTGVRWTLFCPSFVTTGMFEGAKPPLLTPFLSPEQAVAIAYRAFKRDRYLVKAPFMVKMTPLLGSLLPTPLFDLVAEAFGVTGSMREWKGH